MVHLDPALNIQPQHITTIHIMGICGTGMAALASMLKQSGFSVTGSDGQVYPPMSTYLESIGIAPFEGYRAENLDHTPDLVIVGNVITRKNPEAAALAEKGIPYLSFPQALAQFFIAPKTSIVICGTHGKTTTCSLMASSLYHAGYDPGFMIGGIVSEFQANNRLGNGEYFVVEGDEYDTAFFDKESKFLHYLPHFAIITSIEFDHADIFDNLEQIKSSFRKFVRSMPAEGCIIANLDDPNVAEIVAEAHCRVEGYGAGSENVWKLTDVSAAPGYSTFTYEHGGEAAKVKLPMSGRYNCFNSLAVAAVLHHIGCSSEQIADSLAQFKGVRRRQEIRGVEDGITVIDDFAHHPTAVRETLSGLRQSYPANRLIVVFEPRTNSSRRAIFQHQYVESFDCGDIILARDPLPLEGVPEEQLFSSARLAADLRTRGKESFSFAATDDILNHLDATLTPGDVVAILSNGGFDNIHERLLQLLRERRGENS